MVFLKSWKEGTIEFPLYSMRGITIERITVSKIPQSNDMAVLNAALTILTKYLS